MREPAGRSEWSSGTPIVILPGLLCDGRMFSDQLGPLQAEVLNGFYEDADTIEAMATLALQHLPDRSVLIGHSMGGRIALEIWRQAPGRVAGLVLADTGVHPVGPGEPATRYGLRDFGRSNGAEALVERWLPPMVAPANRDRSDLMRTLSAMAVGAGVACFARQTEALLSRPDARPVLATITCPTLVLCGAEDAWSPPAQHQEIAAAIPGAVVQLVPGAGHMAPAEAPAAFNDAVLRWLALPAPTR